MNTSLQKLFSMLSNSELPQSGGLFEFDNNEIRRYEQADINFLNSYFTRGFDVSLLKGKETSASSAHTLFDISFNAFDIFLNAWLSELPVERETIRFAKKIIASCQSLKTQEEKRRAADKITSNRADEDTITVLNAAAKTGHEIHRMMGLLRFSPDKNGWFTAKCEPDHLILPALGEYFSSRFGETPWSVIDIKRGLCLKRSPSGAAKTCLLNESILTGNETDDEWEELWKHYHKIINNEDRNNPVLQRQFMPQRYWKYLPEK